MVTPTLFYVESTLTGRHRARRSWFGKLILQVECNFDTVCGSDRKVNVQTRWRDAKEEDVGMRFGALSAPAVITNYYSAEKPLISAFSDFTDHGNDSIENEKLKALKNQYPLWQSDLEQMRDFMSAVNKLKES